ncbi:MAG: T9SS type A sorting domain-containing protein [bacterium]
MAGIAKKLLIPLILTALEPVFPQIDEGGPDGFGYYYESTLDLGDTLRFHWIEPAGHNQITSWTPNPDDGWSSIPLPYRFPFYGDTLDSIIVCTNGFLQFPETYTNYHNQPLPTTQFCRLIALFWDDLTLTSAGAVYYYNDPISRSTVVTWLNVPLYNQMETITAQVVIYSDGTIQMNYLRTPSNPTSATIGIQGNYGMNEYFTQFLYNGRPLQHIITNQSSVRLFIRRLEHDVGVNRLISPEIWFPTNGECPVQATVKNYGLNTESFAVCALILRNRPPYDTGFNHTFTVTNLSPGETTRCDFGSFIPGPNPDSWVLTVQTELVDDRYRRNDTLRRIVSSFPPEFGTVLSSWEIPGIGLGMNLTGITYLPDSNRFYFVANNPNRIFSFPAADPINLRSESLALQNFFGDDIIWGIAWDRQNPGFWISHSPYEGIGCIVARYAPDGTFTGDTWTIGNIEPGAWFAGIDQEPQGTFYAVAVGGNNRIYHLDFTQKQVLDYLPGPVASWRAISYLGAPEHFLFTGGWNDNLLLQIDCIGNRVRSSPLPNLADLALYHPTSPSPDSFVWAYATINNPTNTILLISLGVLWRDVALEETPSPHNPFSFAVQPNPCTNGSVTLSGLPSGEKSVIALHDISGRLIFQTSSIGSGIFTLNLLPFIKNRIGNGVYFITVTSPLKKQRGKIVLLNQR